MIPCNVSPASEEIADFIVRYSPRAVDSLYELAQTRCVNLVSQEYAIVHAPLSGVLPLSFTQHTYSAIPKLYGLQDTTALEATGILPVFSQPNLMSTGQGILIGMIDTGIDYTNPLFQNPDGTSRILRLWDQTIESENTPEAVAGFQPFYGTVYSQEDLNRALASEQPLELVPSTDTSGHGTFLAGVAAGRQIQSPTTFSGAAPDAALAVVRLKPAKQYLREFFAVPPDADAYQENDIMAAAAFLLGVAGQYQMPLLLCLGVGTSQGSHSGISPLAMQLQALSGTRGFACVTGAGNETGFRHHYFGNLSPDQEYEDVELRVADSTSGFSMELWADVSELYTVGFVSPSGEVIERIPMTVGQETTISFQLDATRILISYQITESSSGRFYRPGPRHLAYPGLSHAVCRRAVSYLAPHAGISHRGHRISPAGPGHHHHRSRQRAAALNRQHIQPRYRKPLHPQQPRLHRHRTDQAGFRRSRRGGAGTRDSAWHFPPVPADRFLRGHRHHRRSRGLSLLLGIHPGK